MSAARAGLARLRRRVVLSGLRRRVVKIHGQQRTGTNFVHRLVKANAPEIVCPWPEEGGWKHGPYEVHRRWQYLLVARHPLAWAESMHDWEVAHGRSTASTMGEFLRAPLQDRSTEVWGTADPLTLYATSYAAWLSSPHTSAVVRYEDLLDDLPATMTSLFDQLDLRPPDRFRDIEERADLWQTTIARRPLDRGRARDGWRAAATDEDLDLARQRLPTDLLDRLGYTI